MFNIFKIRPC